MKLKTILIVIFWMYSIYAQNINNEIVLQDIPDDLPIPTITVSNNPSPGYIFATVPFWGSGNPYVVVYDITGKPVYFKKTIDICTDFKLHANGLFTYYDYGSKKFYALDSTFSCIDSFWTQNDFITDEHDIKFLENGSVLLIGYTNLLFDMSKIIDGGNKLASVVVNCIQEITNKKEVVFEWKAYEHYEFNDVGSSVNLTDPSFVFSHLNSIDLDYDGNIVVSSRNLNEITKINRLNGEIIWHLGGKNNQFSFTNDTLQFSTQHSAKILSNGNILIFDNGFDRDPKFSRVVEYRLDQLHKTAEKIWSFNNSPNIVSRFWGNAQRLENGNTFISWGFSSVAATEVNSNNEKVFEMTFPKDVYSYRIFKFNFNFEKIVSVEKQKLITNELQLFDNYPNPFNPTTKISYSIPQKGLVQLVVYDVLGKEVANLVNSEQLAGNYEISFNANNLSSGIYFYTLSAGEFTDTKKMLLIK